MVSVFLELRLREKFTQLKEKAKKPSFLFQRLWVPQTLPSHHAYKKTRCPWGLLRSFRWSPAKRLSEKSRNSGEERVFTTILLQDIDIRFPSHRQEPQVSDSAFVAAASGCLWRLRRRQPNHQRRTSRRRLLPRKVQVENRKWNPPKAKVRTGRKKTKNKEGK